MNIVRMESRHLDEVVQLGMAEEELHTRSDTPEFYSKATLERWIKSPNGFLFAAETDDRDFAGFVLASYNPDCRDAYVHCVATTTEFRKQGVGSLLLDATLKELRQTGCNFVRCLIALDNDPSVKLFEKHGFKLGDKFHYVSRNI